MPEPFHFAIRMDMFHVILDLGGTFVFALSGAVAGVKHRLDIFGVLVLSFAAANAGGIARDVMMGATPVAALSDWRYVAVSLTAGLLTFYCYEFIDRLSGSVLIFDAAGGSAFRRYGYDEGPGLPPWSDGGSAARDADGNRRWHAA